MTQFDKRLPEVRVSEKQLREIDELADKLQMKKSEMIREALRRMYQQEIGEKENQMNTETTISDARSELQQIINTLMVNEPFENVMIGYPKAGERIGNALQMLHSINLNDEYGQTGKTILANQVEALEMVDLAIDSESLIYELQTVIEALTYLQIGVRLVNTDSPIYD